MAELSLGLIGLISLGNAIKKKQMSVQHMGALSCHVRYMEIFRVQSTPANLRGKEC